MSRGARKLSIVILNWNNFSDTFSCLQSILNSDQNKNLTEENLQLSIVLIDNNSNDNSDKQLKFLFENTKNELKDKNFKISLIQNNANFGYAGGNNIGIRKALNDGADYILILNNDTLIQPDSIQKLLMPLEENERIGIVGPMVEEHFKNGKKQITMGGEISWLKPELKHKILNVEHGILNPQPTTHNLQPHEYVPGAAMLVKKEVFEKIGPLPEEYFLYFEDADFCFAAQKAGFNLKIAPEAKIIHKLSSSTSKLGSPMLLRYHYRNALHFNQKWAPWWAKILLWPWGLWIALKQLLKLIMGRKIKESKAILMGIVDFYKNRKGQIAPSG